MPSMPEFEADVRLAMAVPEPDPAFLRSLRREVTRPRKRMAVRIAWAALAASVLFLLAVIWIVGPETVLAEFRGLFGYVPGIGVVQNDFSLRILAEPAEVERDGITVQVREGASDAQHTVLVFRIDSIPQTARPANENSPGCSDPVTLQTVDGSQLALMGGDGNGWGTGYETRATFPALPAGSTTATLIIPCLQDTRPGAAPENWQISLVFKPAPADLQVFPVYDLAGAPPTQAQATLPAAATPESTLVPGNTATVNGIRISLDQVMETENGFVLKGSTSWKGMENTVDVGVGLGLGTSLLDGYGAVIPIEYYTDQKRGSLEPQSNTWAFQTNSKAYPGPWTLRIPAVIVQMTTQVSFEVDLGSVPKPGQIFAMNTSLAIAGHSLVIQKAEFTQGLDGRYTLDFTFGGDPNLFAVSIRDPDNKSALLTGTGSSAESGTITSAISYDYLPTGKRTILVTGLSYVQPGPWLLGWQPPASSAGLATPTPLPQACLTEEKWQQIRGQTPGELPPGVGGKLLVQQSIGQLIPQISLINLDTGQKQAIAIGAWSSLSPDGSWVGYGEGNGKSILIAPTDGGKPHPLVGTTEGDSSPMWSPDGNWIAFTRSNDGIYIIHPDGSGLKRLTPASVQARPVDWMPDSRALAISVSSSEGDQLVLVDIDSGTSRTMLTIAKSKSGFQALSPDGKQITFNETVFGKSYYSTWISNLDGSGRILLANLDQEVTVGAAWSRTGNGWCWPYWKSKGIRRS